MFVWKRGAVYNNFMRANGSNIIRHNDPPRTQAPAIFDLEAKPYDVAVDKRKLDHNIGRFQEHDPPRLKILNQDYNANVAVRTLDRMITWVRGTYYLFANLEIYYKVAKESPIELRARRYEDAKTLRSIKNDWTNFTDTILMVLLIPPLGLARVLLGMYNPLVKPDTFRIPLDVQKFLRKVCPEVGSWSDMLDDFVGLDPRLLEMYEEEFEIDFETHCISADDAIRLFPHTKLALGSPEYFDKKFLVRISHAFPIYDTKIPWRHVIEVWEKLGIHIGRMMLEDKIAATTSGVTEKTTLQLWELCHERGLFWTKDGKELSSGQLVYLYSQWMKISLMKLRNRKKTELFLFFIVFNVGRNVHVPDAKPSDWAFVEQYFKDYEKMGYLGVKDVVY